MMDEDNNLANKYEVLEELGSGSFGVVYKGIERATGEIVAIKHIDLESSDDDLQDIQQEISVLSTCSSPFVTQYKTSFLRGHKLWIVMEFLGGGSCLDLLKPGPFDESHVAIICRELLLGLNYLHREGKIHRDVKAANILLAESGKVKLADFGVAAQLTNIKSQRNTFVGTPFWMAPEVIQQAGYDFKADIWSLGITAMELIHGEPPNASVHPMKALFQIPKAPAPRLEGNKYSKDFRDFIAACLVKDPDRRPPAGELLEHRFIRGAGRLDHLQELIRRRQDQESEKSVTSNPRYYEETLKPMSMPQTNDDWFFDTVKAPTVSVISLTQKRAPKAPKESIIYDEEASTPEGMMSQLTINDPPVQEQEQPNTMRRASLKRRPSLTGANGSPAKRRVSVQKQPLAPSTSFGNSPSTVRQFRRIPSDPQEIHTQDPESRKDENEQIVPEPITKEALLGQRAYSKVIDPAYQEVHAQTASQRKRDALFQVARAWENLNREDPMGQFHLLKSMVEKIQADPKLSSALLPISSSHTSNGGAPNPQSQSQKPAAKLVLAQNNPHLKSHRRRQSSILQQSQSRQTSSSQSQGAFGDVASNQASPFLEKKLDLPGRVVPGMEHTKQLADSLYAKWAEGLQNRWPNV